MTGGRAPARHVTLDGAVNVRDIGGYRSVGGPEVVRGRLFRGDSLSQLTSSDTGTTRPARAAYRDRLQDPGRGLARRGRPPALRRRVRSPAGQRRGPRAIYELIASGDHERSVASWAAGVPPRSWSR